MSAWKLLRMPEKESEIVGIVCVCIVSYSYEQLRIPLNRVKRYLIYLTMKSSTSLFDLKKNGIVAC